MIQARFDFDLSQLLNIIKPLPDIRILLLGSGDLSPLVRLFSEQFESDETDLHLILLDAKNQCREEKECTLLNQNLLFERVQRAYEALLFTPLEREEITNERVRWCYHALENSGNFIMLFEDEKVDSWQLKEQLESANFVAVNDIRMNKQATIISARKMHGWGGGM